MEATQIMERTHISLPRQLQQAITNPDVQFKVAFSQLESELEQRFKNTADFETFLNIRDIKNGETSVKTIDQLVHLDLQKVSDLFKISREEFFLSSFLITLRRYLGQNEVSLCLKVANNTAFLLPVVTTFDMNMNVSEFFAFLKTEIGATKSVPFELQVYDDLNGNGTRISLSWQESVLEEKVAHFFLLNFINCCKIMENLEELGSLKELDIISQQEKDLIKSFTFREAKNPQGYTPLMTIFAKNVGLNPNKVAIYETHQHFTYAQLDQVSTNVGANLIAKFGQENISSLPIVLVMEKNFSCVATVLGIWKVGGHFVPIDGSLQEKLHQLGAKDKYLGIVTNLRVEQLKEEANQWEIVKYEDLMMSRNEVKLGENLAGELTPAYMAMTSGSTGPPKKWICSHGGLFRLILAAREEFDLTEETILLQWVPFSFDVFILDLTKALFCSNGSLAMVSSSERLNLDINFSLISSHGVNYVEMTPEFALFALQEKPGLMSSVTTLSLGGDTLSWKTLSAIQKLLPVSTKIYNCYGITEATIESAAYEVGVGKMKNSSRHVPIGRPLRGIGPVSIVDSVTLLPVPVGCVGRLAISGDTVAQKGGQDEEEGASMLMLSEGTRTILTGDSVAWMADGNIDFRRRDESQIKVGGLRINPGELERGILQVAENVEAVIPLTIEAANRGGDILAAAVQISNKVSGIETLLQERLRNILPYYMVPQVILAMPNFPLTPNGKVDKKLVKSMIKAEYQGRMGGKVEIRKRSQETMEEFLVKSLAQVTGRALASISTTLNLRDQGFTSLELIKFSNILLTGKVENFTGIADLFTSPTLSLLAEKLNTNKVSKEAAMTKSKPSQHEDDDEDDHICIVGVAFRLPSDISTIPAFWTSVSAGESHVGPFPPSRSDQVLTRMTTPFTSPAVSASFFPSVDSFDHEFFKIAQNEAKHMCPEQRMFLEVGTEALLDSGYDLGAIDNASIAVYATASDIEYGVIDQALDGVAVVGRQSSVVPSRLSYTYNLKGGNYVVDTACSAALAVVEQAVKDLKNHRCDAAVVGGANIYLYPAKDGLMGTNLIHSPTSECRAFDDTSDGTVSGEGVFAYVLKRESDAKRAGDQIYCKILACCSNSVGRGNGITAPTVDSQVEVIQDTMTAAGVTIDDVDLLETHGTGTILGDQIELCALTTVFSGRKEPLVIGVVKPNFGHLDMVAGFLGILKAMCSLEFNESPKFRYLKKPSKYLDQTRFNMGSKQVNKNERKFESIAGVSAYGLSGTNCHAIISLEARHREIEQNSRDKFHFLLPLDPNNRVGFEEQCHVFSKYIKFYVQTGKQVSLGDVCATQILNLTRTGKEGEKKVEIAVIAANSGDEIVKKLDALHSGVVVIGAAEKKMLDKGEMLQFLPETYKRAPAFPKFIFKNYKHWLNPVKQEEKIREPASFKDMVHFLQDKTNEFHALTEMAHKLEDMMQKLAISVMSDFASGGGRKNGTRVECLPMPEIKVQKISKEENNFSAEKAEDTFSMEDITFAKTLRIICKIWEDCLGTDEIEESSIFRDLGGDSLLTVQMTKLVSEAFSVKVKAAEAFASPTLENFTAHVFNLISSLCSTPLEDSRYLGMPQKMILFPGQGSQKVGMCSSLNSPAAMDIFSKAEAITGIDILTRCGQPDSFNSTEFVQIALFVGSMAQIAHLKAESPHILDGIRVVGGLSVGEFAALVFADAIDFKDALEIVQLRGRAMEAQVSVEKTGMVSVFGVTRDKFEPWLKNNFPAVKFSTFLGDAQFAVGGRIEDCKALVDLLMSEPLKEQLGVIDARLLRVAGAFHTHFMNSAAETTARLIDDLTIRYPKVGIVMNADGQVAINKEDIRFNLKRQTANEVMWKDSMITAYEMGVRKFVEVSPSSVLTPILKGRIKGIGKSETSLIRF
ncbi:reducing polyketide synthase swnK-like [Folsomia candida]|uniref:reducing polyketide synthase swnK-like n=1 Tax=Folsomia candida TaxID=158441 RepID=UPI0016054C8A|nr:reducing polyketide synthase swnK-like [Folsomia candida]